MKTLSICIPTYNRSIQLEELVRSLLEVDSNDFEVVITNNCSTDNTLLMLNGIKDERLVVYNNSSPVPAYYNMILSIFNSQGKYALYCNDRDVIFTERLIPFIDFLKQHEYSFLHIVKNYGTPSFSLIEFEKGFDSLIHLPYCDHPTGMVYNLELVRKHINKEVYTKYVPSVYTWCFLCRDLVVYEKAAKYDIYLWDERPSIYKVQSASGAIFKGQLFFDTGKTIDFMKSVVAHLIGNPHFSLTVEQQKELIISVFVSLSQRVMDKKRYYADNRECAHYGIRPRFVPYLQVKNDYNKYFEECDNTLKSTTLYEVVKEEWNYQKKNIQKNLFRKNLRCDISIILIKLKRVFLPHYRY